MKDRIALCCRFLPATLIVAIWLCDATAQAQSRSRRTTRNRAAAAPAAQAPAALPGGATVVDRGLAHLVGTQNADGGWSDLDGGFTPGAMPGYGAGARSDPACTAMACLALLRTGTTLSSGRHSDALRKGTQWLMNFVEGRAEGPPGMAGAIQSLPQMKLGPLVDTSLPAQCLARLLLTMDEKDRLRPRIEQALDKCLQRLTPHQNADGSISGGQSWAGPALESALCCGALELAHAAGRKIDPQVLNRVRGNFLGGGPQAGANVAPGFGGVMPFAGGLDPGNGLYGYAAAQRSAAALARASAESKTGAVPKSIAPSLAQARQLTQQQLQRLNDPQLMAGFGSIGGEELLSYQMIRDGLVMCGIPSQEWTRAIDARLAALQNADGSWNGAHCITSRSFCTAAAVLYFTADRDKKVLESIATAVLKPPKPGVIAQAEDSERSLSLDRGPVAMPAARAAAPEADRAAKPQAAGKAHRAEPPVVAETPAAAPQPQPAVASKPAPTKASDNEPAPVVIKNPQPEDQRETRFWRAGSKHAIGQFDRVEGDTVVVKDGKGEEVRLPYGELDRRDRIWLRETAGIER